jgi:hypothetical protein
VRIRGFDDHGHLLLDELVSERLSLGELADAFDRLRADEDFRRIVLLDPARQTLSEWRLHGSVVSSPEDEPGRSD